MFAFVAQFDYESMTEKETEKQTRYAKSEPQCNYITLPTQIH